MLNNENYYSDESNREYWSVSQYKSFTKCEACAMAALNGELKRTSSDALLLGSLVDSYFEGTIDEFKAEHPELYTKKGELYAKYAIANNMISKCESSEKFMKYMSGEKQRIFTGEIFDQKWKGKLDSYIPGVAIVDLKTIAKVSDIGKWRYDIQGAIYQKLVEVNTGEKLPFYLACVSKESDPELAIIQIPQMVLDEAMDDVALNLPRFADVKAGKEAPERCESCDYCKKTRELRVTSYLDYI